MTDVVNKRETVAIDEVAHEIYKELTFTEGSNIIDAPFKTMKDIFMFATCLGVKLGVRRQLTRKKDIFRWAQFDSQTDIPLLKAIAIADTNDVSVLLRRNEILTIAEEYANAGIYELRASLLEEYGQPLWNLVSILSQQ